MLLASCVKYSPRIDLLPRTVQCPSRSVNEGGRPKTPGTCSARQNHISADDDRPRNARGRAKTPLHSKPKSKSAQVCPHFVRGSLAGPASMDASSQSWLSLPALAAPDSAAAAACPYCAYPSVIRSCCALRGSEPLLWGHDQALDMLRALSLQRHSVHAEYGSLPHLIDTEDGRTLVRSFPTV